MRVFYMLLALSAGINLGITNTVNAVLGKKIGVLPGALVNYITGLLTAVLCVTVAGQWAPIPGAGLTPWMLGGGVLGVIIISLTNLALPRVPVVYVTIILFTGQVLMGMLIDALGGLPVTLGKVLGLVLIAGGLLWNMRCDKRAAQAAQKDA